MDRKKALKEMKKQKREFNDEEEKSIVNRFVTTIGIVLLALVILYLFIGIFVTKTITFNKEKENEETKEEATIDNTIILASQIFDQKEDEYYVLVYNPEDKVENLTDFVNLYKNKEDATKLYKVDSTKKFNSNFIVTKDSNKNPTNYSELKIISPSLIKISSKTVVEYYEGFEEVKNVFKK